MMTYTNSQQPDAPKLKLKDIVASPNVAKLLDTEYLGALGKQAVEAYRKDRDTRTEWEQRMEKAIKLALQVAEMKNFPWENCSNVKFPILTIAALQFLARISLMTKGRVLTKVESLGNDANGQKGLQAKRISTHLSLQLTEEDVNWHDQDEQAKMAASIMGCAFKKTYYDSIEGIDISKHVPATDIVLDYYTKDIDKANRITQVMFLSDNAVQERVRQGLFCEPDSTAPANAPETNLLRVAADEAAGLKRPTEDYGMEREYIEQHCWIDLDGDGYAEPYVVTIRLDSCQVLRIVARFFDAGDVHRVNDPLIRKLEAQIRKIEQQLHLAPGDKDQLSVQEAQSLLAQQSLLEKEAHRLEISSDNHIVRIDPLLSFTRYLFLPSPDGGVYGLGLGALLGPTNESVNTLVNQLIDSGTMSNTGGGFLGRGVKMKSGRMSFNPFEWKPVDSTGDDLRKSIFPLPVREPSDVLFKLLGLLISYSEKISGATDIMTGVSPGQNTPAETSRNTVEQGMMLFSGIYNRMYRGFRAELKKFYNLNRLYLHTSPRFEELTEGPNAILAADDYTTNTFRIYPAASAEAVSQTQRKAKAMELWTLAKNQPGFNMYEVTHRLLEAGDYEDIEIIFPNPQGPNALPAPVNPKMEIEKAKLQQKAKEHSDQMQLAIAELKADMELNQAKIMELQTKAAEHLANANGVDTGHQIALYEAQIGAAKARQAGLLHGLTLMQKSIESHLDREHGNADHGQGQAGMGTPSGNAGVSKGTPQQS